ncbi:hypothetical protein KM043_016038 [Ampulex compressa]|nr:hypothetical protein KM043_016038 [Ampulex compressa]
MTSATGDRPKIAVVTQQGKHLQNPETTMVAELDREGMPSLGNPGERGIEEGSRGSHIRHPESLEEASTGRRNMPGIDHTTREAPAESHGEAWRINFRHCPPSRS